MKTAVQQIMIGTTSGTVAQARQTLKEIKDTGYDGIELNAFQIHRTPWFVRILMRLAGMPAGGGGNLDWEGLIRESGLEVPAIHYDLGTLERNTDDAVAELRRFGSRRAVLTGMYRFDYSSRAEVEALCRRLNALGRRLAEREISLLYHNHNAEWSRVEDGQTAYDILMGNTDPAFLRFELDVTWPARAGVNVPGMLDKLGKRLELIHLSDLGNKKKGRSVTPIISFKETELGTGVTDLDAILRKAEACGVETAILEMHGDFLDRSPIASLKRSHAYFRSREGEGRP